MAETDKDDLIRLLEDDDQDLDIPSVLPLMWPRSMSKPKRSCATYGSIPKKSSRCGGNTRAISPPFWRASKTPAAGRPGGLQPEAENRRIPGDCWKSSTPGAAAAKVNDLLSREVELSSMQAKIQSDVRDEISKSQRDYFPAGAGAGHSPGTGRGRRKSPGDRGIQAQDQKGAMPARRWKKPSKQLKRLDQMHPEAAESTWCAPISTGWWRCPGAKATRDVIDI
jgi:hypothetical protein